MARDRLLNLLAPDRVAGEVEAVQDEAAHGPERGAEVAGPVTATRAGDREPPPVERGLHRGRLQAELDKMRLVLGLAEDGHVARQQPRPRLVQMVAVEMGDDRRIDPADDVLGGHRQRHERVRQLVGCVLDRRPGAGVVEHRVDEEAAPVQVEQERRAPDELEADAQKSFWSFIAAPMSPLTFSLPVM